MAGNMNSGYAGYSMSKRAAEAYQYNEKPISKWTKTEIIDQIASWLKDGNEMSVTLDDLKKVKAAALKKLALKQSSWHHTSMYVNATDFYSLDFSYLAKVTSKDLERFEAAAQTKASKIFKGDISYTEWVKTGKYSKAIEHCLTNVSIEEKGSFYIVTDDNGNEILRKKIGSNGTFVINYKEEEEKKAAAEAKKADIIAHSSKEALDFIKSNKTERSSRGYYYISGRKPSREDYENGLSNFHKVGEHRVFKEFLTEYLHLETWNGSEWVRED